MSAVRPADILLVEDNPADIALTREIFEESRILTDLTVVQDGEAALDYLFARGEYEGVSTPDLVLLDLNLPRRNGLEVLEELKRDPELRRIPVVILTTSEEEADVIGSYDRYANSFIVKPIDFDQFLEVIRALESFWFSVVKLPGDKG